MGDGRAEAMPDDLDRALGLYRAACAVQLAASCLVWLLIARV
jgi:adenosylcobinamide-phosphate synthase